jgi:hypothetical protein
MDTREIKQRLLDSSSFRGVYPLDMLPKVVGRPYSLVLNLDSHDEPGSHWCALHVDIANTGEYFDPLGGQPGDFVLRYLLSAAAHVVWNSIKYQSDFSVTCGEHCINYVRMKDLGWSLCQVQSFLSRSNSALNDLLVSGMTKMALDA